MATTQVILRTKIDNLGYEADIVTVKAGFARNFLVPQGPQRECGSQNSITTPHQPAVHQQFG